MHFVYLGMKAGEKIYRLVIVYNDETNEITSLCESIDSVKSEEWRDVEPLPIVSEEPIYLSDYIESKWLELTDSIGVVGIT